MVNRENFPIPENIHAPLCCLEIQVPDDPTWKSVVAGLLYELQYWFNWQRDDANSGKECAAVWKQIYLDIDWNLMACKSGNCCQEAAKTYRINPDTGQVEQSVDGGVTWQQAAGGLQQYIVQPPPPVTSGVAATKCDAASNVREQVNQWVTAVSNDFDTATTLLEFAELVILAIVGAVLTILSAGALSAAEVLILTTLAGALYAAWGAGKAVFDAYWVTDNIDIVFCAAFCAIGDDGSFTDAQFSEFWNKCNADLAPSPAKMLFMGFLSSSGTPGLNAMAASGFSADGDCSECGCDDSKRVYVAPSVAGTETDYDGEFTYAESTAGGPSGYQCCLKFGSSSWPQDANDCGRMTIEVLTGTVNIPFSVYYPCGSFAQFNLGLTPPNELNANAFIILGSTPFTLKIRGAPNP